MNLFVKHFPFFRSSTLDISYKNIVVWGIGANVGNCLQTFDRLYNWLAKNPRIKLHSTSFIYKNPPFGYTEQSDFYNTTLVFTTNLCLSAVFSLMFYLERRFGRPRIREFKNAPRKLDIDMIFFNDLRLKLRHLIIPHHDFRSRESVLHPLSFQLGFCK